MEVRTIVPGVDDDPMDSVDQSDHLAIVSNLNRCSGSVLYSFGDNIVQCSLFGPNPATTNANILKKNYFNVYLYPLGKIKNLTKDKSLNYYEHFFKRTFIPIVYHSLLPRSRTYVVLNEIEKGSSFITTSLNAASLALLDSGYPLNYCIGSIGVILDKDDGLLYTEKEYKEKFSSISFRTHEPRCLTWGSSDHTIKASFYIVMKNTNTKPVSLVCEGHFSLNDVLKSTQKATGCVGQFFDYVKSHVEQRFV